ncbi:MAG: 50S ribosomal protein L6 [Pirellulaceae bacterium]
MSRIGKKPVTVPSGVTVKLDGGKVSVEGPKGKLERAVPQEVNVTIDGAEVAVDRKRDDRVGRSMHGLTRALIQNMVTGVSDGYVRKLEIVGVGYLASISNDVLSLRVGYANEVKKQIPTGLTVTCPDQTHVVVQGCDKQLVGQFAAEVRAVRKPEPSKGKGVRYEGEHVKIKPGKSAKS